jgi:hypothetical protein
MILINDLYCIAGFLEGEGYFGRDRNSPKITARQVQKYPLDRLISLLGGTLVLDKRPIKSNQSPIWCWQLPTIRAVGLMMTLYKLMSPKRQDQISKTLTIWRAALPYTKYRTHCPKGHPYLLTETRRKNGWRWCRECDRIKKEKRRALK